MMDLYLPELLKESGLFATWVTNNASHFKFVDDMIEYFGFEKIANWRWLKVNFSDILFIFCLNGVYRKFLTVIELSVF